VTHTTFQELLLTPFNVHEILGFKILSSEQHFCHWEMSEILLRVWGLDPCRKICISFGNLEDENDKTESWRNTYRGVDLKKMRFVPGGYSCTNSPTSCTWRKVVDGYKRNIVSLPKHHIRISRVFATLIRPIVRNTECDPFFFCSTPPPPNGWPPSLARCGAPTHLRLLPCFLFTHVVSIVSLVPGHLSSRSLSF